MTDYPESLSKIINVVTADNPSDIDKAVDAAFARWRKCDEYAEWTEAMIRGQLRSMIHDSRHHSNVQIRRDLGGYGGPAKVGLGSGAVNRIAAMSVLDSYSIDGRALGDIFGKELRGIAVEQHEKANGCSRNARLCLLLADIVPEEKTVRQSVTEKKAQKLIQQSAKQRRAKAAA